jgi:hypothetical protein
LFSRFIPWPLFRRRRPAPEKEKESVYVSGLPPRQ